MVIRLSCCSLDSISSRRYYQFTIDAGGAIFDEHTLIKVNTMDEIAGCGGGVNYLGMISISEREEVYTMPWCRG